MVAILQNENFLIINIAIVVVETVTVTTETGRNSRSRKTHQWHWQARIIVNGCVNHGYHVSKTAAVICEVRFRIEQWLAPRS